MRRQAALCRGQPQPGKRAREHAAAHGESGRSDILSSGAAQERRQGERGKHRRSAHATFGGVPTRAGRRGADPAQCSRQTEAVLDSAGDPQGYLCAAASSCARVVPLENGLECVRLLLKHRADVNAAGRGANGKQLQLVRDRDGRLALPHNVPATALVYACQYGHDSLASLLLDARAAVNGAEISQWSTPMLHAVQAATWPHALCAGPARGGRRGPAMHDIRPHSF
eukprot:5499201-Prymnesium_polylepis.2